jgi:hypothetical protein
MLNNSTISGNNATSANNANGGGIYADDGTTVTLNGSSVSGNRATGQQIAVGGGIDAEHILMLNNSTISGNNATSANNADGGGIYSEGTFSSDGNTVISTSTLTLTNSTVSENSAISNQGISNGGGIAVSGSEGTLTFCTIYGNAAISTDSSGGGISASADPTLHNQITLKNTLVAANRADTGPDLSEKVITDGYNLIQDFAGVTFVDPLNMHRTDLSGASFSTLGIDPQLKNGGGPTQTHALLAGSPAINQIPHTACSSAVDERGVKRPQGSACDIGAYEYIPTHTKR